MRYWFPGNAPDVKSIAPPHQASSRTQTERPDWIKQSGVPAMTDPSAAVLSSFSSALAELVARTKSAIVSVHSHRLRASGFVWKPGLIVTADEALADEGEVSVRLPDGTTRPASIAGRDHTTDIALLRFEDNNIA